MGFEVQWNENERPVLNDKCIEPPDQSDLDLN